MIHHVFLLKPFSCPFVIRTTVDVSSSHEVVPVKKHVVMSLYIATDWNFVDIFMWIVEYNPLIGSALGILDEQETECIYWSEFPSDFGVFIIIVP